MARLIGPDDGQRGTQRPGGHDAARGASVVVYANSTGSTLADILTEAGAAVPGSTLTTDTTYGFIPKFQFPDGVDTVYVEVAGGPRTEVNARYEARVDGLSARVAALEVGTQVLDGDLTVIAGLDSTTAGVLASDGAGWIRKSYSAVKTALGIGVSDVSGLQAALDAKLAATTAAGTYFPFARMAANPDLLTFGAIARDANGAATAAPVVWPDGATGAYAATSVSTAFPGAVDAYTITRVVGGVTTTYTQPAVTRDASTGAVTNRPALTAA